MVDKKKLSKTDQALLEKLMNLAGIDPETYEYTADVARKGDTIIVPEDVNLKDVIKVLVRKDDEEHQVIQVRTEIAVTPWDGAKALFKAMELKLGVVLHNTTFSWMTGRVPPQEIEIECALGQTEIIKWGEFSLSSLGEDATATTSIGEDNMGQLTFKICIECEQRYKARARELLDLTRQIALSESMHKGKAFSIRFHNDKGELLSLPTPKFFDLNVEQPIFRREFEKAIQRNIITPMRYARQLREMGESLKRGILIAGKFGMGKTMLAGHIARISSELDWTFIYVPNAVELPKALAYSKRYQPVLVFAEDVDRVSGAVRTDLVNNLLNQLDGIDGKNSAIMTILTSNNIELINPAMRRPGRIDVVLHALPPDAETVARMVESFAHGGLEPGADLNGITAQLVGLAPAYVQEAVRRSRFEMLRRTGDPFGLVNGEDLEAVAIEVKQQKEMFEEGDGMDKPDGLGDMAKGHRAFADVLDKANKAVAKRPSVQ